MRVIFMEAFTKPGFVIAVAEACRLADGAVRPAPSGCKGAGRYTLLKRGSAPERRESAVPADPEHIQALQSGDWNECLIALEANSKGC